MSRTWLLSVLVVGALVAGGCSTIVGTPPKAQDGGLDAATWRDYESRPTSDEVAQTLSVRWHLDQILVLSGNGATPDEIARVTNGVAQRRSTPHPAHSVAESSARIRSAYLHARDRDWARCAITLASDNSGMMTKGWPEFEAKLPPQAVSLGRLLGTNENDSESILGSLKDRGQSPAVQSRVRSALQSLRTPPFPHHSAESAWARAYLARLYARTSSSDRASWRLVSDRILAELREG